MKKVVIGIMAMTSLLFAGQVSASTLLTSALQSYVNGPEQGGPIYFHLTGYSQSGDGVGETWGVFNVSNVTTGETGPIIWSSSESDYIYGMFYGLTDNGAPVVEPNGKVTVNLQGGSFLAYDTGHYVELLDGPTGRTGTDFQDSQNHSIVGDLLFNGDFESGIKPGDSVTTISQSLDAAFSPTSGTGSGFGDLTLGGSLYSFLNSSSIFDSAGIAHDLFFSFNVLVPSSQALNNGWSQYLTDPVAANAVPEPATMLLFGTGLVSLAGLRRKRNK